MPSTQDPSDEDVQSFIAVTDAPHGRATQYLKVRVGKAFWVKIRLMPAQAHNQELERAINAYFDNPNAIFDQVSSCLYKCQGLWLIESQQSQVYYDESQFHTDKTEGPHNHGQPCKPLRSNTLHADLARHIITCVKLG